MKSLEKVYEKLGIKFCLICNEGISCYGVSEEEKRYLEKVYRDVNGLNELIEFEGGIFTKGGKSFVVVRHGNCFAIAFGDGRSGYVYYKLKEALRGWDDKEVSHKV